LIVVPDLFQRWKDMKLVEDANFCQFAFGADHFHSIASGPSSVIEPVHEARPPDTRFQAMAFANALKTTRAIDANSSLHDALYIEDLGRLLPVFSFSEHVADDLVLGHWLTGGAPVSVKSSRRINQLAGWLTSKGIDDVVAAAGMGQLAMSKPKPEDSTDGEADARIDERERHAEVAKSDASGLERGEPFVLPGRRVLEDFFNEHVIDLVKHKDRYAALGIGFPSAIVLHGPPGCGKTFAVEQLVEYLGWPSFQVDASTVASPYIHDTSKKVAEMFDKAMKHSPSVLVIDEMEAFLADRESGSGSSSHRIEEVAEFLRRIPEATRNEVLVIGMTNRIELIDAAVMRRGRFDHIIQVDPASEEEIGALLAKALGKLPCEDDVDIGALAKKLSGRPLSDVAFVLREGARLCAHSGASRIAQKSLLEALESSPERSGSGSRRRIGFV